MLIKKKILLNKVAIITGASEGLGYEIAKRFISEGASLTICSRNKKNLEIAKYNLTKTLGINQKILSIPGDVSKKSDAKKIVNLTIRNFRKCHILVNNAGIYGPKGEVDKIDWKKWKKAIDINFFGSVLMCINIIKYFKKKKYGKIIQLSGGGATNPLPNLSAYAVSKTAIVRFIETLALEVRKFKIDVNSIAPGALNTKMLDEVIKSGPNKVGIDFYKRALKQKSTGGNSFKYGVDLALFLASSKSDGISGKLISAIWDNWKEWPKYIKKLSKSDVYTLRRIIGRERDFSRGDKC
jgi:NAD(P)-dependent dehydrogenase (short-subunit alcohol dehydrogenase family)